MQTPFNFAVMFDKLSQSLYSGNSGYLINQTHKQLASFGNKRAKSKKIRGLAIFEYTYADVVRSQNLGSIMNALFER